MMDPCTIALQTDQKILELMNDEINEIAYLDCADVFLQEEPRWEDDAPKLSEDDIRENDYDDNF